jgi:hypothetical protein
VLRVHVVNHVTQDRPFWCASEAFGLARKREIVGEEGGVVVQGYLLCHYLWYVCLDVRLYGLWTLWWMVVMRF